MDQFEFNEADVWNTNADQTESKKPNSNSRKAFWETEKSPPIKAKIQALIIPGPSSRARVGDYYEDGNEGMPPHEYLARTRVASPSVCVGKGRTLKGRDLSKVRDDI
ncbi:hypothetical protein SASPL_111665 [Salvia splendens]|uniref:Uncharacterized protein n=1 Tax=Salvia splendens TaxID=180675 RepID=A0A8X8Y8I2_SALSN|nr:uncharacterized protein LOC121800777 [Salvia splendens]KAG6427420.1 hypothetical protein SASPL_111665 [Salvia splendens]